VTRGVPTIDLAPGALVGAPVSGVRVGVGTDGAAVTLRLFRLTGTRVVVAPASLPAQVLALRAAAGGTPVHVLTTRPHLWQPLLAHDPALHVVARDALRRPPGGAALLIDDRPVENRSPVEVGPWQCRLDVRTRWAPGDVGAFVHSDLTVFGAVTPQDSVRIAAAFGLSRSATAGLAQLDARTVGLVRRGRIEYVTIDLTAAEEQVIAQAGGGATAGRRYR
jgi:hypothetical protein